MLGKLLKYDLKWIYKVVVVFYILSFIFSIIGRTLGSIENSVIFSVVSKITFGFAIAMMASSIINCLMRLWSRFMKNLYKDESYLTHTLPIEKNTIYLSKVISAIICIFTTIVVILACLFICYYSETNMQALKGFLELAASTYNTTVLNLLLLVSIVILLEIIFIVLIGYIGIILGHKSNKRKMVKTVIIGFALYIITQIITLALIYILGLFNSSVMNLINTTDIINVDAIKTVMFYGVGIYIIYILFYNFLGKMAFQKGVDVE
ncbi:MAG: hypothetical protein HFJ55_02550 [Clostridia bacterium]|nr:hypothetical protein [Clostridia bacterium]